MNDLSEIDEVRWERDTARADRDRLKADNERLRLLLEYAHQAIEGERQRADRATHNETGEQ